jgi:hypothetical protein
LETERLTAARRHQDKHIAVFQSRADDFLLSGPESVVAEVMLQRFFEQAEVILDGQGKGRSHGSTRSGW